MASPNHASSGLDAAIGSALRALREEAGLSARQLAAAADVSAAMVSRIESGQVSPSIFTLGALAQALDVPLVTLFRKMPAERLDFTHVRKGEGLRSTRIVGDHRHEFLNLAFHTRRDIQFEARLVTVQRQNARPPTYVGRGVVFIHILSGKAVYAYGTKDLFLGEGDSVSLDAEMSHGFRSIESETLTFLTVQAERRF